VAQGASGKVVWGTATGHGRGRGGSRENGTLPSGTGIYASQSGSKGGAGVVTPADAVGLIAALAAAVDPRVAVAAAVNPRVAVAAAAILDRCNGAPITKHQRGAIRYKQGLKGRRESTKR
jgi:hypothetical protein